MELLGQATALSMSDEESAVALPHPLPASQEAATSSMLLPANACPTAKQAVVLGHAIESSTLDPWTVCGVPQPLELVQEITAPTRSPVLPVSDPEAKHIAASGQDTALKERCGRGTGCCQPEAGAHSTAKLPSESLPTAQQSPGVGHETAPRVLSDEETPWGVKGVPHPLPAFHWATSASVLVEGPP
jgi:hypothetical protein